MRTASSQAGITPVALGDIEIRHEVSVVSTQPKDHQHKRVQSSPLSTLAADDIQLGQHSTKTQCKTVHVPFLQSRSTMDSPLRPNPTVRRQASSISAKLEKDRESVNELAAFLKSREPPADNFMSVPEPLETKKQSRRLAFKLFHSQHTQKSSSGLRPMILPDSAVAAKTISGKWYIAISIPLEAHQMSIPVPPKAETQQTSTANSGPITVLKPVMEYHELPKPIRLETDIDCQTPVIPELFISAIDAEDTRALQNYYRRQSIEDLTSKFESSASGPSQPATQQNASASSPDDTQLQSHVTNQRDSGGTVYSETSVLTSTSYSRAPSSASSVSSPSPHQLTSWKGTEPGNRWPSLKRRLSHPVDSTTLINPPYSTSIHCPTVAESVKSDSCSAQLSNSDVAQACGPSDAGAAHLASIRQVARRPGPAPTRKLPDLPEGSDDSRVRARSRSFHGSSTCPSCSSLDQISITATAGTQSSTPDFDSLPEKSTRQVRQEKVKALRSRDMAALKAKTNYQRAIAANLAKGNRTGNESPRTVRHSRSVTPSHHSKRKSISISPTGQCCNQNTVTPIMIVANIDPPINDFWFPIPPNRHSRRKSSKKSDYLSPSDTPPRSVTPSLASSDDEALHLPRNTKTTRLTKTHASTRSIGSPLSGRKLVREEELEVRIRRIENDNALIVQTLGAVVQLETRFQELQKFLLEAAKPESSPSVEALKEGIESRSERSCSTTEVERGRVGMMGKGLLQMEQEIVEKIKKEISQINQDRHENIGGGMADVVPLMRELQAGARVGHQSKRSIQGPDEKPTGRESESKGDRPMSGDTAIAFV